MSVAALLSSLVPQCLGYGFFRRALLAVVLVSPILSSLGCLVVESRMAFFSDAIGHAGLAGIALGAILGLADPWLALVLFSCALALAMTLARKSGSVPSDTAIGVFQSAAVALGVVLLSRGGGFARFSRYLVGDILSISPSELRHLALALAVFVPAWALLFNRVLLSSLGETLARSREISPWRTQALFAVATAVVLASCIQWVGILVIQAMIVLPAAAARNLANSTASYAWLSVAIGLACGLVGLFASWSWSTATGATIVLFAFAAFAASLLPRRLRTAR